ncbi:hypothetical protein PCIT_a1327 [Pseudoalteromonas citrea]|uniref:Uncharacterized protein n=1 Tax=Pseudoalteromonas citrea TaxID=43655 RepID=A0AAD4AME2_9GAMM|nr:hypothetical protein [Pseudoalteromonas citrea]KAF7775194.1 hypothetical protein PCIT_a1327 [Pseudoalteromonas citrea]
MKKSLRLGWYCGFAVLGPIDEHCEFSVRRLQQRNRVSSAMKGAY